ncbi:MAG: 2Fe-2S iron-sulfur cluster-binding protein [Blastocatellia bacterium]
MSNIYIKDLEKFTETDWLAAVEALAAEMHEVDRNATRVWFRFYPLDLVRYLESADDVEATMTGMVLKGDFGLLDKIDTSHKFLYGHRFWPQVKAAVIKRAESVDGIANMSAEIRTISRAAAITAKTTEALALGISAVGLATLNQAGLEDFKASPGTTEKPTGVMTKSPEQIVAERAKDDSQGLLGFLRTINKEFSVKYKAFAYDGKFKIMAQEEIASASQKDRSRQWQEMDPRCWEGPVPIECTSASCGTCWVGVLGGQEKLSDVSLRERRAMKVFGYNQPDDERPFIRLACQAKAEGNTTIVIPPWNAVFGKKVRGNVEELELEPATTSAKALRETVKTAVSGE